MKTITNPKDFPTEKHLAIIIFLQKNIYHEGDQRSIDCPGHGYPAHTEEINNFKYLVFDNDSVGHAEFEMKIENLIKENPNRKDFVCFKAEGKLSINMTISVNI